jgi:hypothetical protein
MAQDALRGDPAVDERRRLLRNLAEVAILAGWLACEDLGNAMSGRAYYSLALDTAREAADDQLTAIACWLSTMEATIHADRGDHTTASALDRAHTALDQPAGAPPPRDQPTKHTPQDAATLLAEAVRGRDS